MMQKCMDTMSSEFEAKYSRLDTVHQFEKCVFVCAFCCGIKHVIYVWCALFSACCREACEQQVSSLTEELQAEKCRVGDLVTEVQ